MNLRDVDELNHAISGSNLELLQLKTGSFQGTLGHMSLGGLSIDQGSLVSPVRARGTLDPERFGLSVFHGRSRGIWNGHPVDSSRVLYFNPGGELDGHTAAGAYGWTSLIIPSDWIESIARTARHLEGLQMRSACRTFRPKAPQLADLWLAVSEIMAFEVNGLGNAGQAKWLIANLRNALGAMLSADDGQQPKVLTRNLCRFDVARRAERYMRERIAEPICVDDVSIAVHVSRRYLDYIFAGAFGTSPARYLRLLRLHEVRRRLRKPGTTTVTREALTLGFNHLSLFSVQYKKTFGESPSETLAKTTHRSERCGTS